VAIVTAVPRVPRQMSLAFHIHVPIVLKSGSLNLLEPSGPLQASNVMTLPATDALYTVSSRT